MTETQYLQLATEYLLSKGIGHLPPGKIGRKERHRWEVIFLVPETLDPEIACVDPPDVRVWVTPSVGAVELIDQM
ncbi:hypothetical protein AB4Z46_34530 [Variovorax sp. M-6]|uniref:hypothetical protein n=1 Tax=Variovorax sp. M-6 TaxID=3233041 RepID=UPI003F9C8A10